MCLVPRGCGGQHRHHSTQDRAQGELRSSAWQVIAQGRKAAPVPGGRGDHGPLVMGGWHA